MVAQRMRILLLLALAAVPVRPAAAAEPWFAAAGPLPAATVLLPTSATAEPGEWRFTTTRPADGWEQPRFDDRGWSAGPAGFGNAAPPEGRGRTAWGTPGIWLRREFTLGELPVAPACRVAHDEDVEVYINGVLAVSEAGFTTAYDDIELLPEARGALKVGGNTIAVHCRQRTGGQFVDVGLVDRREPPAPALQAGRIAWDNPVFFQGKSSRGEVRDPCIVREGDVYYLIFTVYPFRNREPEHLAEPDQGGSPGIKLFSSRDLKTWTFETWLVRSADLPEDCPYKDRFWAPEIHKLGGKFYLIFTADNWIKPEFNPAGNWGSAGYAFVGVADKITGPYRHITYIPGAACDTSLFEDGAGKTFAAIPRGDIDVQEIDLTRLEAGQVRLLGRPTKVVAADNRDIGVAARPDYLEGPWVERVGGKYVMLYAEIYKQPQFPDFLGYWTGAAYAETPLGPWVKDPRGKVFHGGHLAVFAGPDGRRWFSYRVEHDDRARGFLAVDPFELDREGRVRADPPSLGPRSAPLPTGDR